MLEYRFVFVRTKREEGCTMRKWMSWVGLGAVCLVAMAAGAQDQKTKVVFLAGPPSHALGEHEHIAGCKLLAAKLEEAMPSVETVVNTGRFPKDLSIFDNAATVVVYCDGGAGHILNRNIEAFDPLMQKGVGLVCIHYAVETVKGLEGDKFWNGWAATSNRTGR